jgi:hypothetical protein
MVRFLVDLFHAGRTSPKNAQLIFSTHETSIPESGRLPARSDLVLRKGRDAGQPALPAGRFQPPQGAENLERSYLAGRYGALPGLPPVHAFSYQSDR